MITIKIMNHAFQLECREEERENLIASAAQVESKLMEMPASMPTERKAMLVALNICYDYLVLKEESMNNSLSLESKLNELLKLLQNSELDQLNISQEK